jgi:hypothetical protein
VDDDVGDCAVFADALQHALQIRPVGGAGGLAAVDELVDDGRAKLTSLAMAVLALGLDREALVIHALVGLLQG